MKKICKMFLTVFAVLAMSITANAEWNQSGDDEITIKVFAGSEYAGEMFTIDVLTDGKTAEDLIGLEKEEVKKIMVTRTQGVLDENGEYTYKFKNNKKSGRYIAYISILGMDDYLTEEIDFVNISQFKEAVSNINEELAKENPSFKNIEKIIDDNAESFGLVFAEYEKYDSVDGSKVAEIFVAAAENKVFDSSEREEIIDELKKAVFVQMLNEDKIDSVFSDLDLSGLDVGRLEDWYDADFVKDNEALKADLTNRLSNCGFGSYKEYKNALVESFVLAVVKNPDGYKNIKKVMEVFSDETGIKVSSNISDKVWQNLAGEDFEDFDELKDAFSDAKSESGTTGGGTTGGGSKKPSSNKVTSAAPVVTIPEPVLAVSFIDVPENHWAKTAIEALANEGIISGRGNGQFDPDSVITREEFVKLIVSCVEGSAETDIEFSDVDKNAWYYSYIKKAYGLGLVSGYSDSVFGIGDYITRQDVAAIAYRVYKNNGGVNVNSGDAFADDMNIAGYAKDGVYTLRDAGIISGMPNNEFQPTALTTRAQASVIIYNLLYK